MKDQHDLSVLSIAVPCALAAVFTILFLSSMPFNRDLVANRDFITYWATGQQLVHHANPYDAAAVSRIERDAGFEGGASYYMRNAPWALPLALPLGYVGSQAAALPWSLLMLGLLIASARMLWKVFEQNQNSRAQVKNLQGGFFLGKKPHIGRAVCYSYSGSV